MFESDRHDARGSTAGFRLAGGTHRLDTKEIFRELIAQEVRSGRLTPSRRRLIVRYAAHLRLTAVETGRLIAECRDEALESDDPEEVYHALRLVEQPPSSMPIIVRIAIVLTVAIVAYDLATRLLQG